MRIPAETQFMGVKIFLNKIFKGIETQVLGNELYVNYSFYEIVKYKNFYVVIWKPVTNIEQISYMGGGVDDQCIRRGQEFGIHEFKINRK